MCFLAGVCAAEGELFRVVEPTGVVADGVATGNANVGDGEADGASAAEEGDSVAVGDDDWLGVGLGVGEGMIFSQ